MMLCRLKVEGQTLRWYGEPEVLAADSVDFVGFEFLLPKDWEGYILHATFQQADKAYTQVLEDRKCTLPSEIGVGNCGIGLFGYQPGKSPRATTNLLNVQVCQSGFVPNGEYPVPPTPDLYSQLLSQLDSKVDEAEQFAVNAVQAAQQAQSYANQVKSEADLVVKLADDVAKKATQASDNSTAAAQAKEAAETAKRLAETARDAAETAQKAAEDAHAAASQSSTDAGAAKQGAETALKSAQNAAEEAANALSDLRELYQQMQTWAAGVVQDIDAAGSNAIQSVQTASDAQVQRVEYKATQAGDTQVERVKSEGSKYAQMAVDAAKVAQDKAAEIAGKSDQIEANTVGLNELKQDITAITPDDTTVDGKPWTSKKIVDSLCMPFEETGNPVQCYPVENYPLGVKVSWEPTQGGSGDPSPDNIRQISGRDKVSVTRCGRNLLKPVNTNTTNNGIKFTSNDDGTLTVNGTSSATAFYNINTKSNPMKIAEGDYVLIPGSDKVRMTAANNGTGIKYESTVGANKTCHLPAGNYSVFIAVNAGTTVENAIVRPQIVLGSTATPYEPYTGDTYDIALPETVYGGTLDVETGVLTVTHAVSTFNGTESWDNQSGARDYENSVMFAINFGKGMSGYKQRVCKCNLIKPLEAGQSAQSSSYDYTCIGFNQSQSSSEFMYVRVDRSLIGAEGLGADDSDAKTQLFKQWLSERAAEGNALQVAFPITNPHTIQLTPQQITALSGVNTIYTDADGVVVTGAEDPKHTITELKNAIISLGGNI